MIDVRFPTALQIMLSLALAERNAVSHLSSAELAKSLGANPSFVRKLLVPLVQSNLLRSQMGKAGGVRLQAGSRDQPAGHLLRGRSRYQNLGAPNRNSEALPREFQCSGLL